MARAAPLAGIRVLDFSRVLAGPHCGRMLVDLGADVVKIEPPDGDVTRFGEPKLHSMTLYFAQQNCGKRNVSIDMAKPEGAALARQLADKADVVLENFRPGVMRRMGLDYETLSATNPRLVFASISGYGQSGSWAKRGAYAMMVHAEMGYIDGEARYHNEPPTQEPYSHGDVYTALECVSGILAALFQRERTGTGQHVDVSMAETLLCVNEYSAINLTGFTERLPLQTSASPLFRTKHGRTITVAFDPASKGTFQQWCDAMDTPSLAQDPRFVDETSRREHRAELLEVLQAWVLSFEDTDALEAALQRGGLVMGAVRSVREAGDTAWAKERGAVVAVSDRGGGEIRLPNSPWRFSKADTGVRGVPAYRGEHNRDVLTDWLAKSAAEIDALESCGAISARLPSQR
jgi:crotonobetainyl-CoA:carnitine CoA-transferase CaiB-like acyl-CoA transferase